MTRVLIISAPYTMAYFFLLTACRSAYTNNHAEHTTLHCDADCDILKTIEKLQRDFRQRVAHIRLSFGAVSMGAIKDLLKELPAGEVKGQVGLLLSNNFDIIMSSHSVDHLFTCLSNIQAWDFLHPQLLEYLVQELGDDDAKRNMEGYKSYLVQFRTTTKLRQLSGWFGRITETSTFQKIVLSLGSDWEEKTYEEFEELRVSLLRQEVFFQSSLHICGVLTGSLLIVLIIPKSVDTEIMRNMLSEHQLLKFLMDNGISSIYIEQVCLIQDVSTALSHHNKNTTDSNPETLQGQASSDTESVPIISELKPFVTLVEASLSSSTVTPVGDSSHELKKIKQEIYFEGQQPLSSQHSEYLDISLAPSSSSGTSTMHISAQYPPDNAGDNCDIPTDNSEMLPYPIAIQESSSSPSDNYV